MRLTLDTAALTNAVKTRADYVASRLPSVATMQVGANAFSIGLGAIANHSGNRAASLAHTVANGFLSLMNGVSGGQSAKALRNAVQEFKAADTKQAKAYVVLDKLSTAASSVALVADAVATVVSRFVKSERFDTFVAVTKGFGAVASLAQGREIKDLNASIRSLQAKHNADLEALGEKQAADRKAAVDQKVQKFVAALDTTAGVSSVAAEIAKKTASLNALLSDEQHKIDNNLDGASQENISKLKAVIAKYEAVTSALLEHSKQVGTWKGRGFDNTKSAAESAYSDLVGLEAEQMPKQTEAERKAVDDLKAQQKAELNSQSSYARPVQAIAYGIVAGLAAASHFTKNTHVATAYQVAAGVSMLAGVAGLVKHSVPAVPMTPANVPAFTGKV